MKYWGKRIQEKKKFNSFPIECDAQIALDEKEEGKCEAFLLMPSDDLAGDAVRCVPLPYKSEVTEETLTVTFPHTAILYLRSYQKTPDKMKYVIITPGGTVQYDVPIMKVQAYSLDDIFEKGLLMLIPFYIFSHEKSFPEYNSNEQRLEELKAEYEVILERLDELEWQGVIGAFDKRTIIDYRVTSLGKLQGNMKMFRRKWVI